MYATYDNNNIIPNRMMWPRTFRHPCSTASSPTRVVDHRSRDTMTRVGLRAARIVSIFRRGRARPAVRGQMALRVRHRWHGTG